MKNQVEQAKIKRAISQFFGVPFHRRFNDITGVCADTILLQLKSLGLMLAGGAITSTFSGQNINDLDFYAKDPSKSIEIRKFFETWFPYGSPYVSKNAVTYQRKVDRSNKRFSVQYITRFEGSPEEIMDWFDFTITQGVYDFETEEFYFGERFLQDIARRKLVYCGKSQFPICAMYRTKKYVAKGYTCPGSTIMHIALSITRLKIETYADLKQQLMGIDTMYLQGLLNGANYRDELPMDYGQFLVDAFTSIDGFGHEDDRESYEDGTSNFPPIGPNVEPAPEATEEL